MSALTLGQITAEIREVNISLGWRSPTEGHTFGDYIALLHSEVSEALEAYRDHRLADATKPYDRTDSDTDIVTPAKPEGVGSELADVLIRLLDMADVFGIGISGYDFLSDIRSSGTWVPCRSFGDHMAWLHREISDAWVERDRLPMILRTLVTVARHFGIDLEFEYRRKIAYNRGREWQHGGRTLAGERPPDGGDPRLMSGGGKTARLHALWLAMPTDPRGWWTGADVYAFIDRWETLDLPKAVVQDVEGERLTLRCEDARYAAELVDMADSYIQLARGFEIVWGEYSVGIMQAEEKETKDA